MNSVPSLSRGVASVIGALRLASVLGAVSGWVGQAGAAILAGSKVTLSATADGSPVPTFQWKKNGIDIPGATGTTFVILAASVADSGSYRVTASNVAGSAESTDAVLAVEVAPVVVANAAPTFSTQPAAAVTAVAGDSVSLSASATGVPAPSLQWKKNGAAIAGATTSTLTLTGVATSDGGTYTLAASNSVGSVDSSAALVTVTTPTVMPPPIAPTGGSTVAPNAVPAISVQPVASQTVAAGSEIRLSVTASGSPAPSYQWRKNGVSLATATSAMLVLANVGAADAATYQVLVSNSAGSVVSANAVVAVSSKPVFVKQPVGQAVPLGAMVTFSSSATGSPAPTLQWYKAGVVIAGATSGALVLPVVALGDLAKYHVVATNTFGSTTSDIVSLVVAATPVIASQPAAVSVSAGSSATFKVQASGSPAPAYQWKKNGKNISGATDISFTISNVSSADAADYSVEVSNSVGWVASNRAALVVTAASAAAKRRASGAVDDGAVADAVLESRIVNLSVRSRAGSGDNGLIVGFVVGGNANKPMLLRGVGPALSEFGVGDVLADPKLSLFSGAEMTATNDDWAQGSNAPEIASTGAILGAFSLRESSADSAMLANLASGAHTVQVGGKNSETGVALVEVYDAASSNPASLVNLSVRTFVGSGSEAPNLGFVVAGNTPKRVLIRAVGPTLGAFGVSGTLDDPQLELFKNGVRVAMNDNWEGDASLNATFASVGAFGLADANSKDSVLLVTLEPGAYTVVASGVGGSTGTALVEVYDVR